MQRVQPSDLTAFLAIARNGSFRRAAIELGVTPSALSHAIRSLEERIEVRLFNRTTRSVSLTEAGERLFARIAPAFGDIADAIDDLALFRGTPMGSLRINAAEASARLVLAPLVGDFLHAHLGVSLEIVTQGALVDVVSERFDAGVRFGETLAADMIAVPIGPRHRFVAVASPTYLQNHPRPVTPHDLKGLPCIRFRFDSGTDFHWEFERGGVELEIAVEGPFTTNSQDMMLAAAMQDVGIAYVLDGLAEAHVKAGRLVRVLEDWCPFIPGLYLYYPSRRQMPSALRAFIDFTRGHVPGLQRAPQAASAVPSSGE